MTTLSQLRKAARSLPETEEDGRSRGEVAFAVRGKRFVTAGDGDVELALQEAEAEEFLAAFPAATRLTRGGRTTGVRVGLEAIDGQQLNHWVRRAWLARAPKDLVAQAAAADAATPGGVGDLPKAIGAPATRALAGAGITTLAQVAGLTEAELLAMHGVGPKAVRVLGEALRADGRSFAG